MGKNRDELDGLIEGMDELLFASRDFTSEVSKQAKLLFDNKEQVNAATKGFRDLSKSTQDIASAIEGVVDGTKDLNDLQKIQEKRQRQISKFNTEYRQALGKAGIKQKDITKLLDRQITIEELKKDYVDLAVTAQGEILELYEQQNHNLAEEGDHFAELERRAGNINKSMGVVGDTFTGLGSILKKSGLGNLADRMGIDNAVKKGRELSVALSEGGNKALGFGGKMKVTGKIIGEMGKSLFTAFGPIAMIGGLINSVVKAVKSIDKEAGEVSKQFGISYENAKELGHEMNQVAMSSDDILVTQKGLMESQKKLNEYFGTGAKFSGKIAEEFTSIQKRTGLSDKAMGTFTKMAMKSGKPIKSILKDVHATVLEQNKQNKLSLNVKDIQEGISKVSSAIKLKTKGNVGELVKSVVAAKKLGTTLEQVENISSSLLDFESSIQAELEAELLLGKQINLEQARSAALRGDNKTVAEEVMKNQAIMNAFETDNVIAQEAAAKAIGIGRQELADMVVQQQQLGILQKAYGKDVTSMSDAQKKYNDLRASGMSAEEAATKLGDESLAQQLESASISERMEASMEKIRTIFAELAETILPVIEKIMNAVVAAVQWFVKGLKEGKVGAMAIVVALGGLVIGSIIRAVASTWQAAMMLGPIAGPILAGVLTGGLFAAIAAARSTKVGDIMSPAQGVTQVSTKEGGLFELSKNDDLVAAPGAVAAMNKKPQTVVQDNSQLLSVMKEVLAVNKQIAAKSPVLEMAGDKVGNGVEQESREIQ